MAGRLPLLALLILGCGAPPAPPPLRLTLGETRQIVPGPGLPPEYSRVAGQSNNNLDLARHDGRVFLATRKAPDHFASADTRLFVFRSSDERRWDLELELQRGTDLREPRLLSFHGRLFLYFAELGTNPGTFEPKGMFYCERLGPGRWSEPKPLYKPPGPEARHIPWRVKVRRGAAWMTVYNHGEAIYDFSGRPMAIELLRSDDGVAWSGPVVSTGGGSETDFDFDERGDLYAVIRNEAGDQTGWGSKICRASAAALGTWSCAHDPRKYDSPLVFRQRDQILLIGRRHVTESGHYELSPGEDWSAAATAYVQSQYWIKPKRCALWRLDPQALKVTLIGDLPGWGDTCFAALLDDDPALVERVVYNYSSPLDRPENGELSWQQAQRGETRIYRTAFRLE